MGQSPASARIHLPGPDEMDAAQKRIYDQVVSGPRGVMIGPLRAAIIIPALAEKWSQFGEMLRFGTCLPKRLNELAIVVTGRRWTSQIEWWVHARTAAECGVSAEALAAISTGDAPALPEDEWEIYEFARQLQQSGQVELPVYRAVQARWGDVGVVELTAVIGYYTLVSMTLNVHEIPLPEGVVAPLAPLPDQGDGLAHLPPATRKAAG